MTIQTFIEKAIEGGWKSDQPHISKGAFEDGTFFGFPHWKWKDEQGNIKRATMWEILLDHLAWQAVGKVEGWGDMRGWTDGMPAWKMRMHCMIEALAEGKTIEEFLATL